MLYLLSYGHQAPPRFYQQAQSMKTPGLYEEEARAFKLVQP